MFASSSCGSSQIEIGKQSYSASRLTYGVSDRAMRAMAPGGVFGRKQAPSRDRNWQWVSLLADAGRLLSNVRDRAFLESEGNGWTGSSNAS
jgi:hypothetical protein